jgi:hypothetical protein
MFENKRSTAIKPKIYQEGKLLMNFERTQMYVKKRAVKSSLIFSRFIFSMYGIFA